MKSLSIRQFAAAVLVTLGVVGFAGTAHAYPHTYPPNSTVIETSDPTPAPGSAFSVSVSCEPPDTVTFTFNGEVKTAACETGPLGSFATVSFVAPAQPGDYTVTAQLSFGPTLTLVITVTASPTGTTIPKVGGGTAAGDIVRSGLGIVLVGAAMTAVASRRRHLTDVSS